ncbi:hypothetical protein Pan241w_53370 [Gimesia alba]|uniref:Uncharacterized protein n=1 Tax=Gimesia alba TaxID=2527973 RepID=A0A517RMW9_9PLAN|nr:hypothetical protein [Gimesia alba]QDT45218.1 hypothetical protein Pan241w_53370 [Gimesia alba]
MNIEQLEAGWFEDVHNKVPGPVLASKIYELGIHSNHVIEAAQAKDWNTYYNAVLDVCHNSQGIRLYVGSLFRMHVEAREFFKESMMITTQSFVDEELIPEEFRDEYREAVQNIKLRLEMACFEKSKFALTD